MIDQQPFYDLPTTALKLGNVSRSTLYRLIEQRKLVRVNIGSKAVITGESLVSYIDELNSTESDRHKYAEEMGTVEYKCWIGLKNRCLNPNNSAFKYYGAREIKVCDRWMNSYENFLADMGKKPSASHSIDRINNDGDYEPSNCRWATPIQQAANRRPRMSVRQKSPAHKLAHD